MKQYPIWNVIKAPEYSSNRSYGVRDESSTTIFVGTSSRNSFEFLKTETKHYIDDEGNHIYKFYVDGFLIKSAKYNPKTKECISEEHNRKAVA